MKTPYRFAIEDEFGTWYRNEDGNVTTQSTPFYYYDKSLVNWSELKITDVRNMTMGGFFRNYTNEGIFVLRLAKVLRHVKYTKGVNRVLKIHVYRLVTTTNDYVFDGSYAINLAMSDDKFKQFNAFMGEAGIPELIKTREETKYDIPVTGPEVVRVKVLPQLVRGVAVLSSVTPEDQSPVVPNRPADVFNMIGYSKIKEEVYEVLNSPNYRPIDFFEVMATNLAMSGGASTSMEYGQPYQQESDLTNGIVKIVNTTGKVVDYLLKANVELEKVSVKGQLNVYLKNNHASSAINFKINLYQTNYNSAATTNLNRGSSNTVTVPAASDGTFTFTFDETDFTLAANSVLYLTLQNLTPSITQVEYMTQGGMPLMIEFKHRTTEYITPGYNAITLMEKLVGRITNNAIPFDSTLLKEVIGYDKGIDCRPDKLLITSDQCLQGYDTPVIKMSLKDLQTSLSTWLGSGITIIRDAITRQYTQIREEEWKDFFREKKIDTTDNIIADFKSVSKDYSIQPATELIFSGVKVGYEPTDIDAVNIVDDVHITQNYISKYQKEENILELMSPIIASPFALYKSHFNGYSTKDIRTNSANNSYVIQYNPTSTAGVHTALYPSDITGSPYVTGITDPTRLLNPGLTPKKLLIRNTSKVLSQMPYTEDSITDNYLLKYVSSDRNSKLVTKLATSLAISESADIDMANTAVWTGRPRLYYPEYLIWNAPSKLNYKTVWEINRFGFFRVHLSFLPNSHPYLFAFPVESADATAKNESYTFKGLLTASNNMQVLIR